MEKHNQEVANKNNFKFEFGNINFKNNIDEPLWDKLIDQIIAGNVIPVIGADMLIDNEENLHTIILDDIAQKIGVNKKVNSFTELVNTQEYKNKYKFTDIYYNVAKYFEVKLTASERLRKLLSIKQFPFVITTSYTPIVEQVMRDIWKDVELKVMTFNNDPNTNSDIKKDSDLRVPTVYYMFGKAGSGAGKYVLTDLDLLSFVTSWLSNMPNVRPQNLCSQLKDKYLLMLGNTYSDWLFRFMWYSMRKPESDNKLQSNPYLGNGMLGYDTLDESLVNFLELTKTFTKQNTNDVVNEIVERYEKKMKEYEANKFDRPQDDMEIFISYSRSDTVIAERLYNALTEQGKRVWYDKKNITLGGFFEKEIKHAIITAKYFVPILSSNVLKESDDRERYYRKEWAIAIENQSITGGAIIIPLAEEGFNFYKADIPEGIKEHNAAFYSSNEGIDSVVKKIIHKLNEY